MAGATAEQTAFVTKVAARLPFKVVVTSWGRTAAEQASAMLKKHAAAGGGAAGDAELHATYAHDSSIAALLALPRSVEAWGAWIAAHDMGLSRHLSGRAVDFSVRGLTRPQIEQLKAAIGAVGGRALEETAPPHVHADVSAIGAAASAVAGAAKETARSPVAWIFLTGLGIAAYVFRDEILGSRGRSAA